MLLIQYLVETRVWIYWVSCMGMGNLESNQAAAHLHSSF